jgi:trk system potassium uptake protein TrkA
MFLEYNSCMNIIIAGAGQVGYELAKILSAYHNVVVIDRDSLTLSSLNDSIDILPVHGDVEDPATYEKILDREHDLFIAVTNSDEANLISTIIASDTIESKTNIIRLKNHFFSKSSLMEKFDIDEAIFPIELTSKNVVNLLKYPKANNVKKFKYTDKMLISLKVNNIEGATEIMPKGYVVVGIERGKEFFIPSKSEPIYPNDLIYLFGDEIAIHHFCEQFVKEEAKEPKNIVIFGADDLGVSIAKELIEEGKELKLIDKDLETCKIANEKLGGDAVVLNSKYGTSAIYEHEGLEHADVAIATSDDDEYNIIKCLEAKERGI